MNRQRLRPAIFSTVRLNPYVPLLAGGIQEAAPHIRPALFERLTLTWCLRECRQYDIIHLHWAELQYRAGAAHVRWQRFVSFVAALGLARCCGLRLVYTVHNLAQHEGRHGQLNRWANRLLFAWADAIHVHDQNVADVVASGLRDPGRLFIIPHGSYAGYYPDHVSRDAARGQLGLEPDAWVYLSLGGVRPYKGMEELIAAFSSLEGDNLRLVIAGHAHEPAYAEDIRARAGGDERIVVFLEHVPDEQVQVYMRAADVCVLPYRQATTSGAAILALSFQLPIIAPDIGPFPALIRQTVGITYDPSDTGGLRGALNQARHLHRGGARQAIAAYLQTISWPRIGSQHAEMYRRICEVDDAGR